jgi:hypothetical protein
MRRAPRVLQHRLVRRVRAGRAAACECERTSNFSLSHAINLVNGSTISESVSQQGGRIAALAKGVKDDGELINELYLSILNRPATEQEKKISIGQGPERVATVQDLAWALMNSPAFLFNR